MKYKYINKIYNGNFLRVQNEVCLFIYSEDVPKREEIGTAPNNDPFTV